MLGLIVRKPVQQTKAPPLLSNGKRLDAGS